ncbi:MAG: Slp family lipoprotein [Pseudomonadota bacterium]|nr:Slp family lipoprotein [Pseudomonadota bacterium]
MVKPMGFILLALLLAGCATSPLPRIAPGGLELGPALVEPAAFQGTPVTWGGIIILLRQDNGATLVEVEERKLSRSGLPQAGSPSYGYFLIRAPRALDPAVYSSGRYVTVRGTLAQSRAEALGSRPYTLPVVEAQELLLWHPDYSDYYADRYARELNFVRLHEPEFHPIRDFYFLFHPHFPDFRPGFYYGPGDLSLRLIRREQVL